MHALLRHFSWCVFLFLLPGAVLAESIEVSFPAGARAPHRFEALASLAPPLIRDTEGVSLVTESSVPGNDYIIDGCCFGPCPSFASPTSNPGTAGSDARFWVTDGAPFFERTLFLDGVPQSSWRVALRYE